MSYLEQLRHALSDVGIRGRLRERIVAEFADHLQCDPQADLGEPRTIAGQFADELGTARARRAAVVCFGALAMSGVLFALAFLGGVGLVPANLHAHPAALADAGIVLAVLGSQISFVAGSLGALRAWRRRGDAVLSSGDATVIARRMAVGVGAGIVTMTGLMLSAAATGAATPARVQPLLLVAGGAGIVALLVTVVPLVRSVRLAPARSGTPGDLFDDLGALVPRPFRGRPWRFAFAVAAALAIVIALAGAVQDDGIDGALRGLLDGAACLAGFGVLGRYLALRR